ncbi:MAG: tRNA pseudouridine(55) synthase TruB [Alistipes sp.]|nr:tRNA pseudouridine(55) synthase TruB [Alistipes sp.]MBR0340011.1 tRNA pseudouridine(55) synthase TruB [Alistipes sp.]
MRDFKDINLKEEGYIAVIDKPLEWTSSDVVRKIKFRLNKMGYRKIKVGHAGTLDPLATGILLVCIGKATKQVDALQAERKEYVAELMLGATTPSYDMEHPVDKTYPIDHITREKVEEALVALTGERLQAPPIYSAKKVEGLRAYELARAGEQVELRKALINIYSITLEEYDLPKVRIRVGCSKGTYIRSLAQEIGEKLDSGAYLTMLRRTRNGQFSEADAESLDDFLKKMPLDETKD